MSLNAAGAVLNELTGQSIASLSALSVNDLIEVYGNYNSQRAQLVALTVTRNAERLHYGSEADVNGRVVKAEGFITAIDANTFTMDVKEASFVPEGNTIDVIDFANAAYLHGNQSTLAIGVKVEVKGVTPDGQQSGFQANLIEVESGSCATLPESEFDDDRSDEREGAESENEVEDSEKDE